MVVPNDAESSAVVFVAPGPPNSAASGSSEYEVLDPPDYVVSGPSNSGASYPADHVAPGPPNPALNDVVYVASTRSTLGLPAYRDIVPAICARNRHDLALVSDDILTPSRVDVEVQHRDTFRVDYIAGFASQRFSYFVAMQRSSATADPSSPLRSYLARVCHADRAFASYVEVPLECRIGESVYSRVRAVRLTHPGSALARDLGFRASTSTLTDQHHILVAVFGSGGRASSGGGPQQHAAASTSSSVLCVYAMRDVRRTFTAAIQKCFRGIGNTGPDHLVQPKPCFLTVFVELFITSILHTTHKRL